MAVTVEDFRGRFPEFAATPDVAVDSALDEARQINSRRDLVTLYIAAHVLTISAEISAAQTGARGAITSTRAGPLKVDYTSLVEDGDIRAELARTQYGARALLLESRNARSMIGATVAGAAA